MSDAIPKILIIACSVILTLLIIAYAFDSLNSNMDVAKEATEKTEMYMQDMLDSDKTVYDGREILGSEVLTVITKFKGEEFGILVCTKKNTEGAYYGWILDEEGGIYELRDVSVAKVADAKKVSNDAYINPSKMFLGELLYDGNEELIGIKFTQQ